MEREFNFNILKKNVFLVFVVFVYLFVIMSFVSSINIEDFCSPPCGLGEICIGGRCRPDLIESCRTDLDCDIRPGGVCEGGMCEYELTPGCITDSDCFGSYKACIQGDCRTVECTSSSQCSKGDCINYACIDNCANVATDKVFKIINNQGTECMRVDMNGNIWFKNEPSILEAGLSSDFSKKEFVIKDTDVNMKIDSASCAIFFRGTMNSLQSSISVGSNEFIIKNNLGVVVTKIDASGNLYTKGSIGMRCGCTPGTFLTPTNVRGDTVLQLASDLALYAKGWCEGMQGCGVSSYSAVTNDRNSCRCDPNSASWGCFSTSCTTSSYWKRYSSITCSAPCSTSAECGTGNYCTSSHTCAAMPICAEPNVGFGYNSQESYEDLFGQCSTSGCGTGNCKGGVYACGYYTDGLRHNCGLGRTCNFAGECEFDIILPGECDFPCIYNPRSGLCEENGDSRRCLQPLER